MYVLQVYYLKVYQSLTNFYPNITSFLKNVTPSWRAGAQMATTRDLVNQVLMMRISLSGCGRDCDHKYLVSHFDASRMDTGAITFRVCEKGGWLWHGNGFV
jgi:hypothetical protein